MSYNKTQLNPDTTMERHVYHRDQFAHYLRWTHVLKLAKINMNILDWGCGSGNLLEVFYRNKFKCKNYLGLDVRPQMVKSCNEKYKMVDWARFKTADLCQKNLQNINIEWDMICSFEVIEHIGKHNAEVFLNNINLSMDENTVLLLSTPCYDENVGAANNHIIDGEIGEFGYDELKKILEDKFIIEKVYGTFASQKDYKVHMAKSQLEFFNQVHEYFDSNILSNLMAPLFPEHSRNCMWKLRKKVKNDNSIV